MEPLPDFLESRGIEKLVTFDFETYFDTQYSLRKKGVSTTEYVRDKRFRAHGVGVKTYGETEGEWISHDELKKWVRGVNWKKTALLAHHAHFDGLILNHHYHARPAFWLDTLSMARAWADHSISNKLDDLGEYYEIGNKIPDVLDESKGIQVLPPDLESKMAEYCLQDVALTEQLFWIMFKAGYPIHELEIIDKTVRLYTEPQLQVDEARVQAELDRVMRHNERLVRDVATSLGVPHEIRGEARLEAARTILKSDLKMAAALQNLDVVVPYKTTPKGNRKPAFAQDDIGFQDLQKHPKAIVRKICQARIIVKSNIDETRPKRLLSHARPALPIYLNYCRAHTMRFSGGDLMNPQNFKRGGELRRSLIAKKGYKLLVVDSAQIEARILAWAAGQNSILAAFRDPDRDPYKEMASSIYGIPANKIGKEKRFVGKVAVLGLGYGMGHHKFRYTLQVGAMGPPIEISQQLASMAVRKYRDENSKIKEFWDFMDDRLRDMATDQQPYCWDKAPVIWHSDGVSMPNGLTLWYPYLEAQKLEQNPQTKKSAWGKLAAGKEVKNYLIGELHYWNGKEMTKIYGGLFTENFIQCLARIVVTDQVMKVADKYRLITMTHDEGVFMVPNKQADTALEYALEVFRTPPIWAPDLPLDAEGGYADNYSK